MDRRELNLADFSGLAQPDTLAGAGRGAPQAGPCPDAAEAAGVSIRTVYKWLARFEHEGSSGLLEDASVFPAPSRLLFRSQTRLRASPTSNFALSVDLFESNSSPARGKTIADTRGVTSSPRLRAPPTTPRT